MGQPAAVKLIPGVHRSKHGNGPTAMQGIQVSEAGAPAAWSVGGDDLLVGTDLTTCKCCNSTIFPDKNTKG